MRALLFPVLFGLLVAPASAHAADEGKDAPIDETDFGGPSGIAADEGAMTLTLPSALVRRVIQSHTSMNWNTVCRRW